MPDGCLDRHRCGSCVCRVGVAPVSVEPGINISEFARLLCVLTQVPHVLAELLNSGMDITRAQSDRHEGRDDMWAKSIETAFNDPTIVLSLPGMADMTEVDASTVPQCHRGGEKLKSLFFKTRALFTKVYERWSASGQNDPDRVANFLPLNTRSNEVESDGKRVHVIFLTMRLRSPDADLELLNFS
jgi:hypothetical protein